ncbi:MAG: orotidine-5'-phosphate decarboxylase [Clostridium sp.]|jgi:orotidine-5'-phosphate decarboxylase|uniref:orotidine-5'-phosphate decarboxylase n=1 Tax=Clostridium sp. TaxID=1506 RepID=UPI0025B952B9|nr:orotidine-5'-phosphate decarboxylase [Clostridium sp.]MCH3962766.1 orotidine-5'-phosphate decarboxylase [Clostridium sp.]MCI1715819.1 orotidine-5'-phosphate decarboxylase [Clostridium sp.]MCI1799976.1 orotidine-5'-phosphate decarboxylase [Clostridium sp.]MCI1813890.1 orotidine-5'-phosphate decarboxylase [Clostridium sp.]MCI1870788.1 orotidine-5'-phosphate decarboxylase [Clostridium sp.]
MIIDRLYESVKQKGPVCVGLDTSVEYMPENIKESSESIEDAIFEYNRNIIDSTFDIAACYKVQIAYYEALGIRGFEVYSKTLKYIKSRKGLVIADIKRGDIAKTAEMYAKAHFEGDFESDIVTLNPYMGLDTIAPYIPYIQQKHKGIFVLVRTSNGGAKDIQYLDTQQGGKVYRVVGEKLKTLGDKYLGKCGYSSIGGVMGCTHLEEGREIRKHLDNTFFLIPGYGAQGGAAKDVAVYLKDGNGGVVNSSRGILMAYKKYTDGWKKYGECARMEVLKMRDGISHAVSEMEKI